MLWFQGSAKKIDDFSRFLSKSHTHTHFLPSSSIDKLEWMRVLELACVWTAAFMNERRVHTSYDARVVKIC